MNLIKFFIALLFFIFSFRGMMLYETKYYSKSHKIRNNIIFIIFLFLDLLGIIGMFYYGSQCLITFVNIIGKYMTIKSSF